MKKLFLSTLLLTVLGVSSVLADFYPETGYYRIRNVGSQRYATVVDNRGTINYKALTADFGAILTILGFENVESNPGSVIYLERNGTKAYNLNSQGMSTYDIVEHYLTLFDNGDGSFQAYASQNGITLYISDGGDPLNPNYGGFTTNNKDRTSKLRWWEPMTIDASGSNFFGVKPTKMADGYYCSFFAGFPYSFASSGMSAYYVNNVDEANGFAIITPISGNVPGGTPVIIKGTKEGASNNRLNLLTPFAGSVKNNMLKGIYFCNDVVGTHRNVTEFNRETMRVLGTTSDGHLGFVTPSTLKYIPANTAYLEVAPGTPAELRVVTEAEYQEAMKVKITANSYTRVYGGANPKFEYTKTGAAISGEPAISCEATVTSPVGTYPIKVSKGSLTNSGVTFVDGTLTITPAPLTVTVADVTREVGTDNPAFTLTYQGFKNGETEAVLTKKPVATTTATKNSPVGTYDITVSGGEAKNYTLTYKNGKLTVADSKVTVKAQSYTRVYGEANPTFAYTSEGGELKGKPDVKCEATATSPVGTYPIKVSKGSVTNSSAEFVDGVLTVTPAPLTATAADASRSYGDDNPTLKVNYSGFKNGETEAVLTEKPVAKTTATKTSAVGKYEITVSGGKAQNYTLSYVKGSLEVKAATLTVTADNATREEGKDNPAFTLKYEGFKNGETEAVLTEKPVASTTATKDSPAGTYDITVVGGKATNYTLAYKAGTLTVTGKKLTVKAKNVSRAYGDANPKFEFTTEGGEVKGGAPALTCEATATSPVGTYAIKVAKGTLTNDNVEFVDGVLTITPAPLTVTVANAERYEGDANPEFTITYSGFKNGENETVLTEKPVVATKATTDSPAGEYVLSASGGKAQNYALTYVSATLTVKEKPVTVQARSYTRVYGEANPKFSYTTEGGKLKGEPVLVCDANEASPVGTYPIKVTKGTMTNGDIEFIDGTLTVTPAPLIVAAVDATRFEGDDNPDFELTYQGFKNGDTEAVLTVKPTVTTDATTASRIGRYTITVSGGEAQNYTLSYQSGMLTVVEKKVTVTAKSYTRVYGEANPALEYVTTGGILHGQPQLVCEADASSPVGTYVISVEKGSIENSDFNLVYGTLTITPAVLTVGVADAERYQGEANPEFELSYSGFRNGDTPAALTALPVATTEADKTSPAGNYDIAVSGGQADNYTFSYQDGTLTVKAKERIVMREYVDGVPVDLIFEIEPNLDGELSFLDVQNAGDPSVTKVIIPAEITVDEVNYRVTAIHEGALSSLILESLVIPSTIKTIGEDAFAGCPALVSVEVKSEYPVAIDPAIAETVFSGVDFSKCVLYVPYGCSAQYATAPGWKQFKMIAELEPQAVRDIRIDGSQRQRVYTLSGQRVEGAALSKGVYIINGRKVMVK